MKSNYTILYVEDDVDDLMLISEAFEQYTDHLTVVHAPNGKEGLSILKKMKEKGVFPCLVIVDVNMPIMNGKEMIRKLRSVADYKHLPIILFTTSNSASDRMFAQSVGATFITKPQKYTDLKALVGEFVSRCAFEAESAFHSRY